MRAGLLDDSGRRQRRGNVGRAGNHRRLSGDTSDLPGTIDAVLNRQHDGIRTEQGCDQGQCRGIVIGLDGDDNDVHRSNPACVFFRSSGDIEVAEGGAANGESAVANRREVRAARDERHIVTRLCEASPVVATDCSRSEYCESHHLLASLLLLASSSHQLASP